MKRSIIPFLALALLYVTATAQGEWKWAHYWTGGDGTYGSYYNKITNTAFDDEGNMYVYGTMGGSAVFDGTSFHFSTEEQVLSHYTKSIVLFKFDALGNLLWHKVVKSSAQAAIPRWMEVRNGRIYISGDVEMEYVDHNWNNVWLYYLDTLIRGYDVHLIPNEERRPPYMTGAWTFIATLDADGELLQDHFWEMHSRERYFVNNETYQLVTPLCVYAATFPSPFHVDNQGNIYVYTPIQYKGIESDSLTVIVDGDTNKTYNLFLPGNVDPDLTSACINNALLYKFSPTGELLSYKLLVDHTDGIASSYPYNGDSVNRYFYTFFEGVSFDEEDNMYLAGHFQLAECYNGQGGEAHEYPVHFWWDSIHNLTMIDISAAYAGNFIVKYDTIGNVLWSNQVYTQASNPNLLAHVYFYGCSLHENSVFVCGDAENIFNTGSVIYFENDTNNHIGRFSPSQQTRGFYVEFNKDDGSYVRNSIIPNNTFSILGQHSYAKPAIRNNQIVISACTDRPNNTKFGLARWCTDGNFIDYTPIVLCPNQLEATGPTILNDYGFVLTAPQIIGNIAFSEDVVINGDAERSSAVFALYQNPEYCHPYTDIPSYEESSSTLRIWPNPAQNHLNIRNESSIMDCCEIIDVNGKIVVRKQVGDSQTAINVSTLPAGVYFLKAVCGTEIQTLKFVKTYY